MPLSARQPAKFAQKSPPPIGTRDTGALCWSAGRFRPALKGAERLFPLGWLALACSTDSFCRGLCRLGCSNILLAKVSKASKTEDGKKGLMELSPGTQNVL
jgi:hypothetical protein